MLPTQLMQHVKGIFWSISNSITVTFMFHSFSSSLEKSKYLSLFSFSLIFTLWSTRKSPLFSRFSFCCCYRCSLSRDLVFWPGLGDLFVSQNPRELCASFSKTNSKLCIYHLFVWSNFNFLHNSQWITFSAQSCLVLHSFKLICWIC